VLPLIGYSCVHCHYNFLNRITGFFTSTDNKIKLSLMNFNTLKRFNFLEVPAYIFEHNMVERGWVYNNFLIFLRLVSPFAAISISISYLFCKIKKMRTNHCVLVACRWKWKLSSCDLHIFLLLNSSFSLTFYHFCRSIMHIKIGVPSLLSNGYRRFFPWR
jgi:hypothetical protein